LTEEVESPLTRSTKGFKGTTEDLTLLGQFKEMLTSLEVTSGEMLALYNKIDWSKVSPDGQLGGKGYIVGVEQLREFILKMVTDANRLKNAITDECDNNPSWSEMRGALESATKSIQEQKPVEEQAEEPESLEPRTKEINVVLSTLRPMIAVKSSAPVVDIFKQAAEMGVHALRLGEVCGSLHERGHEVNVDATSKLLDSMVRIGTIGRDGSENYYLK